ncbi:MAG TPA: 4Fe-4S dicluster domain-containing protein [bacterium]|nr:4Fe-4S dicluster domain-containing protein [bacterium]
MPDIIDRAGLEELLAVLIRRGYRVIGPTVRDGAIVCRQITSIGDLPEGWTEEQEAGNYRLRRRGDTALFGYTVGPTSWKPFLFPPSARVLHADRAADGTVTVRQSDEDPPPQAFFGVRACDLAAIGIQDRVFLAGAAADPVYRGRRAAAFIVAVQCTAAGPTCFCASMGTGPRAEHGFDLALTEVVDGGGSVFVVETGSERGAEVLAGVTNRAASADEAEAARDASARAAGQMRRTLATEGLKALLEAGYEHPRWDEVAARCLACANCTMVCPTCFCSAVEERTDLTGDHAERWRRWDSCFAAGFSYIHGGSVRASTRARYRQWLTHKLATWIDQFGTAGCVGCGRCITWCPVGIDLTEEVRAIRGGS